MQDGNVFYRRQQLYSVGGKFPNFADFIIAGCRYGGPLALMRDASKLVAITRATPLFTKPQIQIYSSAGESLLICSVDVFTPCCTDISLQPMLRGSGITAR
jgi:vacuolar protein sorting-associated protein 16